MKRLAAAVVLVLLPALADARVRLRAPMLADVVRAVPPQAGGGGGGSIVSGTTPIVGGTDTQVCYNDGGTLSCGDSGLVFNETTDTLTGTVMVTGAGTVSAPAIRVNDTNSGFYSTADNNLSLALGGTVYQAWNVATGGSATSRFFTGVATMPTTLTATLNAHRFICTGAGSSSQTSNCFGSEYAAGYTGSSANIAGDFRNANLGTGTTVAVGGGGNYSVIGLTTGVTSGDNIGIWGGGWSGSGKNYGVVGYGNTTVNSATAVGVLGLANSTGTTPTTVGGWFQNGNATPTFTSTALGANNGSVAVPIFTAQDNGTTVFTIENGGALWSKQGAVTLADGVATAFVRVAVTSNGRQGGIVDYCVDANDATNYQTRCGSVPFAFVNEAGTEGCTAIGTPADADGTPTGTLTVAFTGATNAADTCDILANAASSLTETTLRINYTVRLFGNAATVVTPQ